MVCSCQAGTQNGAPTSSIRGFRALDVDSVKEYLVEHEDLATRLGPSDSQSSWQVLAQTPRFLPLFRGHCSSSL